VGVNLRSSVNHFPQGLQHFWIRLAAIRVRILFLIPQTDCNNSKIFVAVENRGIIDVVP
jgi:hypothetical protein